MPLRNGTEVLVKVRIIRPCRDERPLAECGYEVETSRGSRAYVEPRDIFAPLVIQPKKKESGK